MDCSTHFGVPSVATCLRCARPVCAKCRETLDGKDYCSSCVAELRVSLAQPPADGPPTVAAEASVPFAPIVASAGFPVKGVLFAAIAGVIAAIAWYGVVEATDMKIGIVAIGVGWLVGRGAVMGGGGGGKQLALFSCVTAVLAMVLGEYLIVNHAVHTYVAKENPGTVLPALLSPMALVPIYLGGFGFMDIVFYAIGAWEAFRFPMSVPPRP